MDLQVKYEKFRRRPDDWQLPLYDMQTKDITYAKYNKSPKMKKTKGGGYIKQYQRDETIVVCPM